MLKYCIVGLFLLTAWAATPVIGQCEESNITECMANFTDTYPNTTNPIMTSPMDTMSICSGFDMVKECVEPFVDECNETIRMPWDNMNETLGGLCTLGSMTGENCDVSNFTDCTGNLTEMYPNMTTLGVPLYNVTDMMDMCSQFQVAQECVGWFVNNCSVASRLTWDIFNDKMEFMCSNYTMEMINDTNECLTSDEVREKVDECDAPFEMMSMDKKDICSSIMDYKTCVIDATDAQCSANVNMWMSKLLHASLDLAMNLYDCDGGTVLSCNWWLMTILTGSLLLRLLN